MPREKKDAKVMTMKVASPVYDRLAKFCDESGMTKTLAVEKILDNYFDDYFQRPEKDRKLFK